jgi:hypothetical protein
MLERMRSITMADGFAKLKADRAEAFKKLLEMMEECKRKNQYE